jgi:hypothetical protein
MIYNHAKKSYGSGMRKSQFSALFRWVASKKGKCGNKRSYVSNNSAWSKCDATRGGIVDKSELRKCLPRLGMSSSTVARTMRFCKKVSSSCWLSKSKFYKVYAYAKSHN